MKQLFLSLSFIFISCNTESSIEKTFETTYQSHIDENNIFNNSLLENIKLKTANVKNSESIQRIKIYDRLSQDYFNYLTTVEKEIKDSGNKIFFEDDFYSRKAEIYIAKAEKYKSEIEKLTNSENFIKRLDLTFNIRDVEYKDNIRILYLDYYFKGYPKIQSASYINDKKRSILEFENEFIDEIIIRDEN